MEKIIAAADSELWFTERMAGTGFQYSLQVAEVLHAERTPFQRLEVFRTTGFGTSSTELIAAHARTITPAFCACVARRLEPPDFIMHKASH